MISTLNTIVWRQFGAAIDMLENALHACPNDLWLGQVWQEPGERPEYGQVWFLFYHTLFWLDLFLNGTREGYVLPDHLAQIERDEDLLPLRPYTKAELQAFVDHGRRKCQATITALTEETVLRPCHFAWMDIGFLELQLYSMRHVQEHAAQLSLYLGEKTGAAPDWVVRAGG